MILAQATRRYPNAAHYDGRRPGEPALGPQTGFTTYCSNGLVLAGGLCGY